MTDIITTGRATDITEDAARGGLSPHEASAGAVLTPMLVWGTVLATAGLMAVALLTFLPTE
jgi:hypothetical protein